MFLAFLLAIAPLADPMTATFRAVHRDHQAQLLDEFADTTADAAVVGKRFKIVNKLHSGDTVGAQPGPWFTYKEGKLRLVFPVSRQYVNSVYSGPSFFGGIVGGSRTKTRSYIGSNAYGATARVQVEKLEQNGIAFMSGPQGEVVKDHSQTLHDTAYSSDYTFEVEMRGPEARKVAEDSSLIVEGSVAKLPDGKLAKCKGIYGGAEIDNPLEVYGETCWVGADVSRVAFIRSSTGEVLKEWVMPGVTDDAATANHSGRQGPH